MKQEKKVKEQFKVVLNEINSPNTKKRPNTYQQPYKSDLLSAPLLNLESNFIYFAMNYLKAIQEVCRRNFPIVPKTTSG